MHSLFVSQITDKLLGNKFEIGLFLKQTNLRLFNIRNK